MTEVKVRIDLTSAVQRKALNDLFDAIAATTRPLYEKSAEVKPAEVKPAEVTVKPVEDEPKKPKTTKAKAVAKEEAKAPEEAPAEIAESSIKISDVRAVMATKVQDHRAEIKAKLTELGANNVTSLDESVYEEFHTFLTSLEK